jgi:DNA-binding CsgD family transcriptional regulator
MDDGDVSRRREASSPTLLGRASEKKELDRLFDSVRAGLGGALVLRGPAGMGKTALLEYAMSAAPDMQVVRVVGVQSEMELGYAGLHVLLRHFAAEIDSLPPPQREAIRVAFGSETGEVNRMVVGLATLTVLSAAGSVRPVLCLVDDAQWIDRESAEALAFAARRLRADAVGALLALRQGEHDAYVGLPELTLAGLGEEEAAALLARVAGPLAPGVADRVVAETGGNPLALIELGAGLSADRLAGRASVPEPLPIGRQLERRFVAQVRRLPLATQALLLTASADTTGDPVLLLAAGRRLGFGIEAAEAAEAVGILAVEPRVEFRHPLIRSAVYYSASSGERRRAHEALAEATDADRDPDRRAWHRAAAAGAADESVAEELERAAERARSRGGCAAAASFLARSAELSPDTANRATRLLAAAEEEIAAGAPARAQPLLERAVPGLASRRDAARARAIEGELLFLSRTPARAAATLLEAANGLRDFDLRAARNLLLDAMEAGVSAGQFAEGAGVVDVARAALEMPLPPGSAPSPDDLLLDGHAALYTGDFAAAAPRLKEALNALRTDPGTWSLRNLAFACWAALAIGDIGALDIVSRGCDVLARAQGAWFSVTKAVHYVVLAELAQGSIAAATAHAEEGRELESTRWDTSHDNGLALCLAWSGREAELRQQVALTLQRAADAGWGWHIAVHRSALALLELGRGDYEAAWASMPRARDLYPAPFAVADYIEAAVLSGNVAAARPVLARYEYQAAISGTPLMLGLVARCQGLLAADEDAEARYQESTTLLEEAKAIGHAARSRLLYGEWLRRVRRRLDARQQLRSALTSFEAIGADGFAERARAELLVTGERVGKRAAVPSFELTAQEAEVAHLAAEGATNAEIAARLFISPNTVDYHLRKVYPKLGVSSRVQLRSALSSS